MKNGVKKVGKIFFLHHFTTVMSKMLALRSLKTKKKQLELRQAQQHFNVKMGLLTLGHNKKKYIEILCPIAGAIKTSKKKIAIITIQSLNTLHENIPNQKGLLLLERKISVKKKVNR